MTKLEAVRAAVGFDFDSNLAEKIMIDKSVTSSADYSASDMKEIDLIVAELLLYLITGYKAISEGSLSYTMPTKEELIMKRQAILKKHGLSDMTGLGPSVNSVSSW